MRDLVVVLNVFDDFYFNSNAIESVRYACKRWGADFFELKNFMKVSDVIQNDIASSRLWMMQYFTDFDRVVILDPDIIINSNCPNIFDELGEFDFCGVHNANPSRTLTDHFTRVNSYLSNVGIDVLENNLINFNKSVYNNYYINGGVYLFNPKKLKSMVYQIIRLIETNESVRYTLNTEWVFIQNLISAVLSTSDLKIKILDDTWNYIGPMIDAEWDLFNGPMHSNIYHFTGVSGGKEMIKDFHKWKI